MHLVGEQLFLLYANAKNNQHSMFLPHLLFLIGCPGSHIVIRCGHQNLDNEVVMDAASLAARQSKCAGSTIKVSVLLDFFPCVTFTS